MLLFGPGTDRDWLTVHVMEHSHVNDRHLIRLWWLGPRVWHNGYVLALNWPWAGSQACNVDGEPVGEVRQRFYEAVEDAVLWVEEREW
jgi:hypothetical protein